MAIKTLNDYIKDNNVDMTKTYTTKQLQDLTWTNKQKKQMLTRYQPKKEEKKNILERSIDTLGDIGTNILHAPVKIGRTGAKFIVGGIAQVEDWMGFDEEANRLRKNISDPNSKANKMLDKYDVIGKANEYFDKSSYSPEWADKIAESIGDIMTFGAAGEVNGLLEGATMFMPSAGETLSETYYRGGNDSQAWTRALGAGGISLITENLFGLFGKSGIDKALANQISSKLTSGAAKVLARQGVQATFEALEELLEYGGDYLLDKFVDAKISGKDGVKFSEKWDWKQVGEQMAEAFVASSIYGAADTALNVKDVKKETGKSTKEAINEYAKQVDASEGVLTKNEEAVAKKVANNKIKELLKTGKEITAKEIKQIQNEARKQVQEGNVSVKDIEGALNLKQYSSNYIQEEQKKAGRELTEEEKKIALEDARNSFRETLSEDYLLQESYNQEAKKGKNFSYDLDSTDNEYSKKTYESAINYLNDTNNAHKLADTFAKMAADKNVYYEFINNEALKKLGLDVENYTSNGLQIDNPDGSRRVLVNVDSNKILESVLGHESYHLFENSDAAKELRDLLFDYAKQKGEYYDRRNKVTEIYKNVQNANIDNELAADLLGDYLYTDEQFLRDLSTSKPTLFQKIKQLLEDLIIRFKGTKEEKSLREIQKKFAEMYRTQDVSKKIDTSSNEIVELKKQLEQEKQKNEVKEKTKQETKKKEENILPVAEKAEVKEKQVLPIKEETKEETKKVEKKETKKEQPKKVETKEKGFLTQAEQEELEGLQAAEEAFGNEGEFKERYEYLLDKKNGNLKYSKLKTNTTYQDIKNVYNKYKNNMKDFNDTTLKEAESFVPGYRNTNKRTKEQWLDIAEMVGKRGNFETSEELEKYAIQSWFKEQPNQKQNLNRQGQKFVKFGIEDWINAVYKGAGVGERIDNSIKYSLSETGSTQDDEGRKLSKAQVEFFKDSKATDGEGNLITVYHTTTGEVAQFNEFNPVGTQYYRFGDQVVNYYTDSKDMSGSYADQKYNMADTKQIKNIEDIKNYIHDIYIQTGNQYNIQEVDGKYQLLEQKPISKEAIDFLYKLNEDEIQQMRDNIYYDEKMANTPYEKVFSWNNFDSELQNKYHNVVEKYVGTDELIDIQKEMIKYIENPSLMVSGDTDGNVINTYNNKEQMFRNIKSDIQKSSWTKNTKLQYEGYVNITNPYIVDAEQRNWNQVVSQSNEFIDDIDERVPQDIKNNLTRLYQESANISSEAREKYNVTENIIRQGINAYNSAVNEDIKKANEIIKKVGYDEIQEIVSDISNTMGVNGWYNIASALQEQGIIGETTSKLIIDDFVLPNDIKEWLKENYNKEIPIHQIQTDDIMKVVNQLGRTTTLKDIYNKNQEFYKDFDKYRMPSSYFMEQISAEGNDYLGNELNDMFETRAEMYGAEQVGEEIAQAASVAFSKPEMIRLWGTSKTTNDVVKEIIASNKDGLTNYDGVIIKNVYDYGGRTDIERTANNLYVTFNSNQFKAADNTTPTTDSDIRYSLSAKDNQGRTLSKQQQEYFKDSKNITPDGSLRVMYRGGGDEINVFDRSKAKSNGQEGNGFYFTTSKDHAAEYGNVKEYYLNIVNPVADVYSKVNPLYGKKTLTKEQLTTLIEAMKQNEDYSIENYGRDITTENIVNSLLEKNNDYQMLKDLDITAVGNMASFIEYVNDVLGTDFDGIITDYETVVLNSNQIKSVDNTNPTDNPDIRYSLSENRRNIEQQYNDIRNQRDDLRTELFELRQQRNEIINNIPDYSMFKQYDELTDINRLLDENKQKSIELYEQEKSLEKQLEKIKEKEKQQEIKKINKKTTPFKDKQFALLQKTNPMLDDYHTGIRQPGEIRTWEEAMYDAEQSGEGYGWGDFSKQDAEKALKNKSITIYSSYPIKNGVFVTPSYAQAQMYAGGEGNQVYSKTVNPDSVAWIDVDEGQYANVGRNTYDPVFSLSREGIEDFPTAAFGTKGEDIKYQPMAEKKAEKVELPISPAKTSQKAQKVAKTEAEVLPMAKSNDVLMVEAENIADQINKTGDFEIKPRGWLDSIKNTQAIEDKGFLKGLDLDNANYQVQTNQKSVDLANEYIERNGYDKSVAHAKEIIKSGKTPAASDVALLQRMTQEAIKAKDYQTAQELIMDTAILGTDLGQAVQAMSIIKKLTPEGQLKLYSKMVDRAKLRGEKAFRDVEITPQMVEKVLGAYNEDGTYDQNDLIARVEEFKQDIANQMKPTVVDKANAWRYLSMLGNPKTHIRNMVSNVAMKETIKVKNAIARTLETILPIKDRTKTLKPASADIKDFAKATSYELKDAITGENKYNEKAALEAEKQIFKNKTLEKLSKLNSAALEAEDWFFSRRAFEETFREYLTANGINSVQDIENNPDVIEKGKIYAVEQAEIATFRQFSKLASEISRIERNNKGAKLAINAVLPFKKTPINVAKAGFNYSPLGLIKNISYDAYQLQKGNINASQFIDNISQGLTGTSIALLGYALAKAGILTGSGDDDKEDKYKNQLGQQNYAVNVGGKSYSISWLSPVAMPLLVGSNMYEKLEEGKDWNADIVIDTLSQTLDPLSEMSFISGLTDTLKSYSTGGTDMIKNMGETAAQSYILQFFPTLFGQLASTLDDKKRSTKVSNNSPFKFGEETMRKIMLKIPGLRNQLEVQTDIWGNEKEQSDNIIERAFESFLAPYSKTEDTTTALDNEIKRVYDKTGETSVIPGIPQAYVKKDSETYRMSASEYTKYKETYGQTANNTLNDLINSTSYKNAEDEDKVKMIENVYKYAREQAKQEYFDSIKEDYTSKELNKVNALEDKYGIDASEYYGNKAEYNYASSNPEKYLAIKTIGDYDTYSQYKEELKYIKNSYDNTNDRKQAVYEYINSLPLDIEQKLILQKLGAGYSVKNEAARLRRYIDSLDLSIEDKQAIDNVLFK